MKTIKSTASSTGHQTLAVAKMCCEQRSLRPIMEHELELVAAASSKPGASGGAGTTVKPKPKPN